MTASRLGRLPCGQHVGLSRADSAVMETKQKVRYAVAGLGNIAQVAVLPAFKHAQKNSELTAIISGDVEKRRALRDKYDLKLDGAYDELESVLKEGAIDALYVATPNALHKALTLRAAAAGVHVLCEKPLAMSVADCEEMAEACDDAGVKLMVGYRLHFDEATLSAIELVKAGKLGDVRCFDSVFTHVVRPGDIRESAELGGGAVYDLGVYCINAARNLFRDEPLLVFALSQKRNGVDDTTTAVLQFAHNRVAQFTVSNSLASVSSYRISGTEGDLRVEPAYDYAEPLEHHLTVDDDQSHESFSKRDQFSPELEYFSSCILEDRMPEPSVDEAIADLRVVEAILQSAESGKPIPLEPRQRARRPGIEQQAKKPPVGKQRTIHAPSPSLK
ncbi:MAG TPA: Gfo/Idh/MocA family oxidoreductase [Polyangiaceae bacterium]|nr:Gfo/Idh/MocA family oxidoreductase [Polyangiaceae bacterium]